MNKKLVIAILAAGKGTRMNSNVPKVLHDVNGQSMIQHVLNTANKLGGRAKRNFLKRVRSRNIIK